MPEKTRVENIEKYVKKRTSDKIRSCFIRVCCAGIALLIFPVVASSENDNADLRACIQDTFDTWFPEQLRTRSIPCGVVAVVNPHAVVYGRGFGNCDPNQSVPADFYRTQFRVASISKLFVVTAILQLWEQGRIDLNAPVNTYLKSWHLKERYAESTRILHLLTHTGGFDDQFIGMAAPSAEQIPSLGAYLARHMPEQVMPPGRYISYSNHGMALAGHVVECITGKAFSEYARTYIFEPLNMGSSHFAPTPAERAVLAPGYTTRWGGLLPQPYDYPITVPASSLITTGEDICHFLCAMLNGGVYGGHRILQEETVALMQAQHFTHHPDLPGMAYGFEERFFRGHRVLEHSGLISGYASLILLIPEQSLGFFVTCNTDDTGFCFAAGQRFLDATVKEDIRKTVKITEAAGAQERIAEVCGYYRHNRYCRRTFLKLGVIVPQYIQEVRITPGSQPNTLYLRRGSSREELVETAPYFFCKKSADAGSESEIPLADTPRLFFERTSDGCVTHAFLDRSAYERLAWYESRRYQVPFAVGCNGVFVLCLIVLGVRRLRRNNTNPTVSPLGRDAVILCAWTSGLFLSFALGFGLFLLRLDQYRIGTGDLSLLGPPVMTATFAAALVYPLWLVSLTGLVAGELRARTALGIFCVALAAAGYSWLLGYWNLLGYAWT